MGTYRPLFSVTVEHAYFPAQICKTLRFAATDACSALLQKAGLLLRCSESGIAVYFDEGKNDFLRLHAQDSMILTFKVFSADSNFFRYTAPGAPPDNAILYFDNRRITRDDSGKRLLHADSNVTQNAWMDMTADPLPEILERKDYLVKPAFVVQIAVTADAQGLCTETLDATARKFYIRFAANRTFWNYYILGDLSKRPIYIADLDNAVQFKHSGNILLPGQREAVLLRSSAALPLQERPQYRLQLRESGTMGDKVLIKRLPNADINQTHGETIDGKQEQVSEIYVG